MPTILQHFAWIPLRLFMIIFCSVKIRGVKNIEAIESNVIIAINHSSELDPLLVVAALPYFSRHLPLIFVSREKSFYTKSSLAFIYGGTFFSMMGAYPAYVGLNDYQQALRHHLKALDEGKNICIFPVGKKHSLTDLANAKGGVSYLAQSSKLPIVPIFIDGLAKRTTRDYLTRKCKLTITVGQPVYAKGIFNKTSRTKVTSGRNIYEQAAVVLMEKIVALK